MNNAALTYLPHAEGWGRGCWQKQVPWWGAGGTIEPNEVQLLRPAC